ncbi:MAG: T9SS type A sorting domain-containing protein [Bacteroidales bacterium]|nr:T9SS type A sorting domain-containing protein [Bacteroidales bacterium]
MKYLFFTLIILFSNLINAQNIIGESVQSTATERNNARLIVEDSNGYLHVVYYNNGIYYSFSDDNGTTWTDSVLVDESGRNPSIAINGNNIIHLVYKFGGTNAYDIVHRTYEQGIWSEFDYVYHDANMISPVSRPVIAVDSENNLHCVWQRAGYSSIPNSEIWYNKYNGTVWETPLNISNTYGASEYPTLTIDNDDNIYAFWKDSGEDINNDKMVLLRKYTVGSGWDADYTNISNTTGNGSYATMDPCAITDIDGNIHLVWKDSQTGNREIFYKKCTDGIWDEDFTNISNTAEASARPTISIDNYGNLYVFWEEKFNGIHYDIANKKYDANLEIWSDITNISNTENNDSQYPNGPNKISNSTSVIWTEGDASPFSVMYYGELFPASIDKLPGNLFSVNIYPNPFSQSTVIDYKLPTSGKVILKIYNMLGQEVQTLVNENQQAGNHSVVWNGTNNSGKNIDSEIYICQLQINSSINRKKIILQ